MAEVYSMEPEWVDPRILRTRQMLFDGLERLLGTKTIEQISVADIADQAKLNRATFYDHYPDKFALLEGLVEARFRGLLCKRRVVFDGTCPGALMAIILAVCDFLAERPDVDCKSHHQMEKHFEAAMIAVVRGMLFEGLKRHAPARDVPPELIAATISGAICGGAREWYQTAARRPADEVAKSIFDLVAPMMLPPGDLPAYDDGMNFADEAVQTVGAGMKP